MTASQPNKPLAIYTRVSDQGRRSNEELHSHDLQRGKVEKYLDVKGIPASTKTYRENNVSGGKTSRPVLDAILADIEAGNLGGIAVAYLDRFARTLNGALGIIERIEKAGGVLVALDADFDTTTPMGKAMLRMALVMGAFYREQGVEKASDVAEKKLAEGTSLGGRAPVGYRWQVTGTTSKGKDILGWIEPDPETAPVVTEALAGFAAGRFPTAGQVADFLNDTGVTTSKGNLWNARNVLGFLRRETYTGVRVYGDHRDEKAHEALIDAATHRVIVRKLAPKTTVVRKRGEGHVLGQGLLRCGKCGGGLTRGVSNGKYQTLRCNARGGGHATVAYRWAEDYIVSVAFSHVTKTLIGDGEDETYLSNLVSLHGRDTLVRRIAEAQAVVDEMAEALGVETLPANSKQALALAREEDALAALDLEHAEGGFPAVLNRDEFEALDVPGKIKALREIVASVTLAPGGKQGSRSPEAANLGERLTIKFVDGTVYGEHDWTNAPSLTVAEEAAVEGEVAEAAAL